MEPDAKQVFRTATTFQEIWEMEKLPIGQGYDWQNSSGRALNRKNDPVLPTNLHYAPTKTTVEKKVGWAIVEYKKWEGLTTKCTVKPLFGSWFELIYGKNMYLRPWSVWLG